MDEQKYNTPVNILYDEEESLFYVKLGLIGGKSGNKGGEMPLHYTVWGKTKKECKERSELLLDYLKPKIN